MKKFVLFVFALVFLVLFHLPLTRESTSFFETAVCVDPSTNDVSVGDTFVINVSLADDVWLQEFEFYLGYNTTILDSLNAWVYSPYEAPFEPQINDTEGYVHVFAIHEGPIPSALSVSESFPLASVTFKATAVGSSFLDLYGIILIGGLGTWIDYTTVNGFVTVSSAIITVPDDYPTIQEAINAANDGATIFVGAGTYFENIVVNKTVSLVGENKSTTVIDGKPMEAVVSVAANNVNLTGFTIQHGSYGIKMNYFGSASIKENHITSNNFIGIYLYFSHRNVFSENCVTGNGYGVELVHSGDNIFRANNIVDNAWQALTVEGNNLWDFIQDMDTSNKVNGKPVYYWVNEQNKTVQDDAGYVAAVNSTNITVRNLTVERSGQGVLLAGTTNSVVERTILTKNKYGIYLCCSRNITINRNTIIENGQGIGLFLSHENNIIGNTITKNGYGIDMGRSEGNIISGNVITEHTANDNSWGIDLWLSENNIISKNNITNNKRGIELFESENNLICHNNFLNNAKQVHSYDSLVNTWDDGYPFGGNYWSDYNGTDWYSGLYQNATGSDGIGDTSFDIDENNQDNYPLMGMFSDFNAASEYCVQAICNSSISDFQFNGTAICFNVTGENGTTGFCRICIPRALMNETHKVFVNGTEVPRNLLPCSNSTHSYLYFTYSHSTQEVIIVPEFPTLTTILIVFTLLTVALAIYKRKLPKTPVH